MIKNYFLIAIRNLWRRKGFSFLNISGLAIGMASAAIIILWIQNEMSYDKFHKKGDRLYAIRSISDLGDHKEVWPSAPRMMVDVLKKDYAEVENAVHVDWTSSSLFTIRNKRLNAPGTRVDPGFLTMFSFPLIKGNISWALNDVNSIVVTEKLAKKLFGDEEPMGKVVKLNNDNRLNHNDNFTVTGILRDLPKNTLFDFEYLIPWASQKMSHDDSSWSNCSTQTYVLLKQNASLDLINGKIKNIIKRHVNGPEKTEIYLFPLTKMRLYTSPTLSPTVENGIPVSGRIDTIKKFILIAALILMIACINFMNLSTAQSEKRAKEVGIRKVSGAGKGILIIQFIGESIFLSFIAGFLALVLIQAVLPSFNTFINEQLSIPFNSARFWITAISFILFTGILAGSYPAFYLSSFKPASVLKGKFKAQHALITPRKVLIITQFTIAIVLIISSITVKKQIRYAQDRDAGYSKDNLIYIRLTEDIEKKYALIKEELRNSGVVVSMTKSYSPLTEDWVGISQLLWWEGKDPTANYDYFCRYEDEDLVKTAGLHLTLGRDFNLKEYPTDSTGAILNESAVKMMGFNKPLGQIIKDHDINWHVVGVIKDFINWDPYRPIDPMVIEGAKNHFQVVHVRFNEKYSTAHNLATIEKIFNKYNPQYPFEYHFIDEEYERKFVNEKFLGNLSSIFTLLTIFISCLGLFGLAAYTAESRIKEIGVRKVLGAGIASITRLLIKDFVILVLVSIIIASPIALWSMTKWLSGFPYRISISWRVFAVAGAMALLIAIFTVSFQAIKAAIANPIKSLRSE